MKRAATCVLVLACCLAARSSADEERLDLQVTAEPRTVAPGEGSVLTVLATSEGRPVADVEVLLESETGVFGLAARAAGGRTDAEGRFRTVWRADPSAGAEGPRFHAIDYLGTKAGLAAVTGRLLLQAAPTAEPTPPARPALFVIARADPPGIEAGLPTRVMVVVRDGSPRGAPVPGARVEARARAGTFGESGAPAVDGVTDAGGKVQWTWLAPSEATAPAGAPASVAIRATREGYAAGSAVLEIGVLPSAARRPPPGLPPRVPAGPIALAVAADPSRVPAGGQTRVTARVSLANGEPVPDAEVVVSAGGGSFEGGTAGSVTGRTGADGTFLAVWNALPAAAYVGDMTYALGIRVSHPRHGTRQAELTVEVVAPGRPAGPVAPALGLLLEAVAEPAVVGAGGQATVRVEVRTRDRRPLPDARVEVATGSGTFEGHPGATATGVTDGAGRFVVVWKTADPGAYRSDLDVVLGVTASARGHGEAATRLKVRVTAAPAGLTPVPATPIPIPGPQSLSLVVVPERAALPAGSTAWIVVRATLANGEPVSGASVSLRANGGAFLTTSSALVQGTTDAEGRFRAQWRTDAPATYRTPRPHEFTATATRAGFAPSTNRGTLTVTPLDIR